MRKSILIISLLILSSLFLFGCNQTNHKQTEPIEPQAQTAITPPGNPQGIVVPATVKSTMKVTLPELNNIKNTKYPDIVAEVGDTKITGLQLTREIAIKENDYVNNLKKPQTESYYEKVSLGLLVENALLDYEVKRQGLTASVEEAKAFLARHKTMIDSRPDNDPVKIALRQSYETNGFSNVSDYINSPNTISATQKILGDSKLKSMILKSVPQGQNEEVKAWDAYIDDLINQGNYKIFIPVDIKGYQQLEENTVLGKASGK